jgi:hypothetical protein
LFLATLDYLNIDNSHNNGKFPGRVFLSFILFLYFLFYFSYDMTSTTTTTTAMTGTTTTHRQHQHHQRVETSMAAAGTVAAAAGARDETRLEPLVCFF